jgi:membrane-associated phospholipid phosphatase
LLRRRASFGWSIAAGALLAARPAFAQAPLAPPPPTGATPTLTGSGPPRADANLAPSIEWNPRWRPVDGYDYTVTGVLLAGSIGALALPASPTRWPTPDSFDASARNALRLSSSAGRDAARDLSDAFLTTSTNALIVDALAVTWWGHDRRGVAWQLTIIDGEALAISSFIQGMTSGLSSRQRPFYVTCVGPLLAQTNDCRSNNRYRSFFSGHTSLTFTTAGLMCQHHAHLPLYGGGAPDFLACILSLGLAGATGYLRVASDQHYVTDVMTGAAAGALSGFLVPWAFHYRTAGGGSLPLAASLPGGGFVTVAPAPNGAGVAGVF